MLECGSLGLPPLRSLCLPAAAAGGRFRDRLDRPLRKVDDIAIPHGAFEHSPKLTFFHHYTSTASAEPSSSTYLVAIDPVPLQVPCCQHTFRETYPSPPLLTLLFSSSDSPDEMARTSHLPTRSSARSSNRQSNQHLKRGYPKVRRGKASGNPKHPQELGTSKTDRKPPSYYIERRKQLAAAGRTPPKSAGATKLFDRSRVLRRLQYQETGKVMDESMRIDCLNYRNAVSERIGLPDNDLEDDSHTDSDSTLVTGGLSDDTVHDRTDWSTGSIGLEDNDASEVTSNLEDSDTDDIYADWPSYG
ncbi:MAG: hypothetical protein Q9160_000377 [Pyrenula sp. 1 TL-2023]